MTNIQKRFLLFGTALPILTLMIMVPYAKHLIINILVLLITLTGTYEIAKMMQIAGINIPVKLVTAASAVLPIITYLIVLGFIQENALLLYLAVMVTIVLTLPVFFMANVQFKGVIESAAGTLLCLIYPGYFLSYIIRFSSFEHASFILIFFMLTVYLNDSFAWFLGVFFGKKSRRNIFPVSPNKSMIGFIGGIFASIVVTIASWFVFHFIFTGSLWTMILLGFVSGITTILGDLVESGIKRSAGVKDSGNIIMGRGGLLDSVDSLLLTAPVFYYFLHLNIA